MQFTIRLKPQEGESLSSYLLRCCKKNRICSLENLWRLIALDNRKPFRGERIHFWDTRPYVHLDIKKIARLTGLSEEKLVSLTYASIAQKLIPNWDFVSYGLDARSHINLKARRICTECVRGGSGHKLIWNVSREGICHLHNCNLIDSCPYCYKYFGYSSDFFLKGFCPNCEAELSTVNSVENAMELNPSYQTWKWLLGSNLIHNFEDYTSSQTLALKLMYVAQTRSVKKLIYKAWYQNLKAVAENEHKAVSLTAIINVVEITELSIGEINQISLTNKKVKSILDFPKTPKELGECQTSWCESVSKNQKMQRVDNSYWFGDRMRYNFCSVCTDCYIEYGYSKETGKWENVGRMMRLIQEVNMLIMSQIPQSEICRRLGINSNKYYEVLLYSDYYMGTSTNKRFELTADIAISCFKKLICTKGGVLVKKSKKLFNWSTVDYYSVFAMKEVKEFLYFKSQEYRDGRVQIRILLNQEHQV